MKFAKIGLLCMTAIIFAFACRQTTTTNSVSNASNNIENKALINSQTTAPEDELAAGRELYKSNCAVCHRDAGTGGKITIEGKKINPENLTADKYKNRPDEKLVEYISDGTDEGMPAFKDKLKQDEIKEVVKYIRRELQGKK